MSKLIDLTNKKFGRFLVVKRDNEKPKGHNSSTYWICKCDCGNIKSVIGSNLINKRSKSCGCLQKEIMKEVGKRHKYPDALACKREIYANYKKRAEKLKISFDISFDNFISLTQKRCFYCQSLSSNKIQNKRNGDYFIYNGIDRVNSKNGYIKGNMVPCCSICNRAKNNLSLEEFINWVQRLSSNLNRISKMPGFHHIVYAD